ncbi:MAG: Stp1/IreP family PP2C-type Ser/Thr phosphatase [Coriobacteriia bacterium]|nr:Stp1/IreP family PP2C-type Ser/Thr phosphatase [Coriobacteriia bacterium]
MPAAHTSNIHFGSRTDVGCQRVRNEDSLIVSPPLYVVADGMGGHNAGDVASEVAVNTLAALAPTIPDVDLLGRAVESANHAVITEAQKAGFEGMGTTMTACVVQGDKIAIAHVGDSRAYLLHTGKLQQLTRDHSWVADMVEQGRLTPDEARVHPNRSVITRALGSDPTMQPDLYEITASEGDRLLLCSDGLTGMVDDGSIQAMLARIRDPQRCAAALVKEAIANGGSDNITVIVVDITGTNAKAERRERRRSRAWIILMLVALVGIIGGSIFAAYNWMQNSAYLAEKDGKVVIYRGIPDSFPGIETHWLVEETDLNVKDLQPGMQARISENYPVDSVDEAERLVEQYKLQAEEDAAAEEARTGISSSSSSTKSSAKGSSSSSAAKR